MKLMNSLLSLAAVAALSVAGAALSLAGDGGTSADLEQYLPIRAALAADKLDGVADHAATLAKSQDKAIAAAAQALAKTTEIEAARKSFGDLSKAVIAEVERATKAGEKLAPVYVFQCPMAKPYGKWLQETNEISNPYMGSKMSTCGNLVASIGAPASEGEKKGEGDGCCGGKMKEGGRGGSK